MSRLSMKTIREFNEKDLLDEIQDHRSELAKLRANDAKGTLRKENGKIKRTRRDIARMLTRLNEMRRE